MSNNLAVRAAKGTKEFCADAWDMLIAEAYRDKSYGMLALGSSLILIVGGLIGGLVGSCGALIYEHTTGQTIGELDTREVEEDVSTSDLGKTQFPIILELEEPLSRDRGYSSTQERAGQFAQMIDSQRSAVKDGIVIS